MANVMVIGGTNGRNYVSIDGMSINTEYILLAECQGGRDGGIILLVLHRDLKAFYNYGEDEYDDGKFNYAVRKFANGYSTPNRDNWKTILEKLGL